MDRSRGDASPAELVTEFEAVQALSSRQPSEEHPLFLILSDFSIYRNPHGTQRPGAMTSLANLKLSEEPYSLCFSGFVSNGISRYFLKDVELGSLFIHDLVSDKVSVSSDLFLRSKLQEIYNVWYHISPFPAVEYQTHHQAFLWLADFANHFTHYLLEFDDVDLEQFQNDFLTWLGDKFGENAAFQDWLSQYGKTDFRKVVTNNFEYLWKCSSGPRYFSPHADLDKLCSHPLWRQIDFTDLGAVKNRVSRKDARKSAKTIVMPTVFHTFKYCYFSDYIECGHPHPDVLKIRDSKWTGYLSSLPSIVPSTRLSSQSLTPRQVQVGDIVGIPCDPSWETFASTWYAYVFALEHNGSGDTILRVFWLYRAEDTIIGDAYYAYSNELFFSDNCNCDSTEDDMLYASEITEFPNVEFTTTPISDKLFIRFTYITAANANEFICFQDSHRTCRNRICRPEIPEEFPYKSGDTVLISIPKHPRLEPVEIVEKSNDSVLVRRLLRRGRDFNLPAKDNELIYTDKFERISHSRIKYRCRIRFYTTEQLKETRVPAPYSCNGRGNCWIITGRLIDEMVTDICAPFPSSLVQGFNPALTNNDNSQVLSTLDLFSGGGFFARGIGMGNAAKVKWSVDTDGCAIHTDRANAASEKDKNLFWGSVTRYLTKAMAGKFCKWVANIMEVDMILAGFPCPAFSVAQPDRYSEKSMLGASLMLSALSHIDLYRPRYGILENVSGITRSVNNERDRGLVGPIVGFLVSLGYQVKFYSRDAFNYGDPQSRCRIFVCFTAPGHTPLGDLKFTHATPRNIFARSADRKRNGASFGEREVQRTPFYFNTAETATMHLPDIGDGSVDICIPVPDHRLSSQPTLEQAKLIRLIPQQPREMSLYKACRAGLISQNLVPERYKAKHADEEADKKAYTRINPHGLFGTVTTQCSWKDPRHGKWLHWAQPRPISIAEARAAQGYSDDEIIIGSGVQQWKLIGNGVPRGISICLGLELRDAWSISRGLPSGWMDG